MSAVPFLTLLNPQTMYIQAEFILAGGSKDEYELSMWHACPNKEQYDAWMASRFKSYKEFEELTGLGYPNKQEYDAFKAQTEFQAYDDAYKLAKV
jgi:hypothetical protein